MLNNQRGIMSTLCIQSNRKCITINGKHCLDQDIPICRQNLEKPSRGPSSSPECLSVRNWLDVGTKNEIKSLALFPRAFPFESLEEPSQDFCLINRHY